MNDPFESCLTHGPRLLSAILLAGTAGQEMRRSLLSALTFAGYRVRLASTSDELLRESLGDGVDLVISDIHLKSAQGTFAIEALKNLRHLRHIPILAYSSSSAPGDEALAHSAGADAFLRNPADLVVLFDTVASMLATHQAHRALAAH